MPFPDGEETGIIGRFSVDIGRMIGRKIFLNSHVNHQYSGMNILIVGQGEGESAVAALRPIIFTFYWMQMLRNAENRQKT